MHASAILKDMSKDISTYMYVYLKTKEENSSFSCPAVFTEFSEDTVLFIVRNRVQVTKYWTVVSACTWKTRS